MSDRPGNIASLVSIVLPAHNEVSLLTTTVLNIANALSDRHLHFEIIVVENGSTDGTDDLAEMLGEKVPQLRVCHLETPDYGAALNEGFARARGDVVVSFDVDYYDLGFLDEARAAIDSGDIDIVVASKRAKGAQDKRPWYRRLLTEGFTALTRALLSLEVSDAHGMKAFRSEALDRVRLSCVMTGSLYDVELLMRAARLGLRVLEIPATVIERRPPRTSVAKRSLEALLGVIELALVVANEDRQGSSWRASTITSLDRVRAWLSSGNRKVKESRVIARRAAHHFDRH